MTLLSSKRVAETLDKLHADADAADRDLMAKMMAQVETSGETLKDLAARFVDEERMNYRATYRGHADHSWRFLQPMAASFTRSCAPAGRPGSSSSARRLGSQRFFSRPRFATMAGDN